MLLLATDGLFDNMSEGTVLDVVAACADAPVEQIAMQLAHRARALSLDEETDSPFAVLAKENDILWGGGRPDDITVLVSRIVDPAEETPPAPFKAYTGPGTAPLAITQLPAEPEIVHEREHDGAARVRCPAYPTASCCVGPCEHESGALVAGGDPQRLTQVARIQVALGLLAQQAERHWVGDARQATATRHARISHW